MDARYDVAALTRFATAACVPAGLDDDKARAVAEVLVEGDLMGHDTHGLALLTPYLDALASGDMQAEGTPEVVAATAVAETWDSRKLPGPWLVRQAIARAEAASTAMGIGVVNIGRCHHIGALAAYGPPVAAAGRMLLLTCSDPATGSVAPWGGTRRRSRWPPPGRRRGCRGNGRWRGGRLPWRLAWRCIRASRQPWKSWRHASGWGYPRPSDAAGRLRRTRAARHAASRPASRPR